MAAKPRTLAVVYSAEALNDLEHIWNWNAEKRGLAQANGYLAFLQLETEKLVQRANSGRPVPLFPEYRYVVLKRRKKGHGHLVVFTRIAKKLLVLRYFHTAQNWQKL